MQLSSVSLTGGWHCELIGSFHPSFWLPPPFSLAATISRSWIPPPQSAVARVDAIGHEMPPPGRTVYPRQIVPVPRNAFSCETSRYSSHRDDYTLRRIQLPSEGRPRSESDDVALMRYVSWEKESGRVLFEATCVVPPGTDVAAFVRDEIRNHSWDRSEKAEDGSLASMAGGWGDDQIDCWYSPWDGTVDCYGVTCFPELSFGAGADPDAVSDMLLSSYQSWDCTNGCVIWAGAGGSWYYCPSGGEGDVCMDDCGGGSDPPPTGSITIECSTNQVQRGSSISCTATGSALDSIRWVFTPDGPDLGDVNFTTLPGSPWQGVMVASGTVDATGYSGTNELGSGGTSQFVHVTVRNWSDSTAHNTAYVGQGELPPVPEDYEDLGHAAPLLLWKQPGWAQPVSGGPNDGYAWVTMSPFIADVEISLNHAAFAAGSVFMNNQTGGAYCTAAQLSNLETIVRNHEDQHAIIYQQTVSAQVASIIEDLVGTSVPDVQTQVLAYHASIHGTAEQASWDLHQSSPLQLPCNANFTY